MVKEKPGGALAGDGEHGDGSAVAPGWQLKEIGLLNPLVATTLPSNMVSWLGKMGPPTLPPVGSEMETVKSEVTITVPVISDP